jgi:hypothetical protein
MTLEDRAEIGALMAIWVRVPPSIKPVFDQWYDEEHLPERRTFAGFVSAERFEPIDGGENNAALYELTEPEVLETPEYQQLRTKPNTDLGIQVREGWKDQQRVLYSVVAKSTSPERPMMCPVLVTTRIYTSADEREEMGEWLEREYVPRLLETPGVRSHQRFASLEGESHFLNLWGVSGAEVATSPVWSEAFSLPGEMSRPVPLDVITRAYRPA